MASRAAASHSGRLLPRVAQLLPEALAGARGSGHARVANLHVAAPAPRHPVLQNVRTNSTVSGTWEVPVTGWQSEAAPPPPRGAPQTMRSQAPTPSPSAPPEAVPPHQHHHPPQHAASPSPGAGPRLSEGPVAEAEHARWGPLQSTSEGSGSASQAGESGAYPRRSCRQWGCGWHGTGVGGRMQPFWVYRRQAMDRWLQRFDSLLNEPFADVGLPGKLSPQATPSFPQGPGGSDAFRSFAPRGLWGAPPRAGWGFQEAEGAYHLRLPLPGVGKENVAVKVVESSTLSIEARHSMQGQGPSWASRLEGSFQKLLRLPEGVKADEVRAHMENGVLSITVPKRVPQPPQPQASHVDVPVV